MAQFDQTNSSSLMFIIKFFLAIMLICCFLRGTSVYALPYAGFDTTKDIESVTKNAPSIDLDKLLELGTAEIEKISQKMDAFKDWKQVESIDITPLYSQESGKLNFAMFDIVLSDGTYGYLVYDLELDIPATFSASISPYKYCEKLIIELEQKLDQKLIRFYVPMFFGVGYVKDRNTLIYYDLSELSQGRETPHEINEFISASEKERISARKTKVYIDGVETNSEHITHHDLRAQKSINYPDNSYISGVPNYLSTDYPCIPTSMANILSYWDMNGYSNLVPSASDSNREFYTKDNINYYLEAEPGGATDDDSIDPAFSAYILNNGSYRYTGILAYFEDYDILQAEIYSYELPCLVGFYPSSLYIGSHCATGVGYDCSTGINYVIVHDNWYSTGVDVYQFWAYTDMLFSCSIRNYW